MFTPNCVIPGYCIKVNSLDSYSLNLYVSDGLVAGMTVLEDMIYNIYNLWITGSNPGWSFC